MQESPLENMMQNEQNGINRWFGNGMADMGLE